MYTALEWLQLLGFGAVLGAAGQLIRTIPGLKKLNDDASVLGLSATALFSTSRMVLSIVIGGIAGMLGAISLGIDINQKLAVEKLIALIGTGYAGADFIEAFVSTSGKKIKQAAELIPTTAAPAQVVAPRPISAANAVVTDEQGAVG